MLCKLCNCKIDNFYHCIYKCSNCNSLYNFSTNAKYCKKEQAVCMSDSLYIKDEQIQDFLIIDNYIPINPSFDEKTFNSVSVDQSFNNTTCPQKLLKDCLKYLKDENSTIFITFDYPFLWFCKNEERFAKLLYEQKNFMTFQGIFTMIERENLNVKNIVYNNESYTIELSQSPSDTDFTNYLEEECRNYEMFSKWLYKFEMYKCYSISLTLHNVLKGYNVLIDSNLINFAHLINCEENCVSLTNFQFDNSQYYLIFSTRRQFEMLNTINIIV